MDFSSGYKAKIWRFWAELLTIRQIAGHSALWQAATYLAGKASGDARLDNDPLIKAILAQDEVGAKLQKGLRGSTAALAHGGGIRAGCGTHPQTPQAAWHHERRGRPIRRIGARATNLTVASSGPKRPDPTPRAETQTLQ